ncbi:hypothetical protein PBAL39_00697 [Pedobacter sp. BAL39]|uniref:hypothetical protein n=1 Tax=Pedobacter sp. BAL39 TaxID=391596 RepID=UPI0001559C90|nr:hypothetical protein [Pedobacter sp. BAL39]EDM38088.1 hypothetical protein PBAL39_00697 [Pedobacter sp. BAL39]
MKKLAYIILTFALLSCNRESSPDGRSQLRDEHIQLQIDSLKVQYQAMADSIKIINKKLTKK